jgi:transcription elongation GreA/GreB family factor
MRAMSRAFVKESDDAGELLPELAVSPHPNWVTPTGLAALRARVQALEGERAIALHGDATQEAGAHGATDKPALARIERDLRYFRVRVATARVVEPSDRVQSVRFGARVTLRTRDGDREFRIVGEDEANPAAGLISWVSPLARALEGAAPGDEIELNGSRFELLALEP